MSSYKKLNLELGLIISEENMEWVEKVGNLGKQWPSKENLIEHMDPNKNGNKDQNISIEGYIGS